MKNIIRPILIFLFSTVAHWALSTAGASFNINVNFMLVVSIAVCSFYDRWEGYTFAFFSGLFLDFFGVNMFGVYSFTFTLCAGAVYLIRNSVDFESAPLQFALVFVLSLGSILVHAFTGIIFFKGNSWHGFQNLFLSASVNSLISPFVFYLFNVLPPPAREDKFL